ncbi:hypothetical protein BpHYR1_039617 [Brachionus plicatilis]|uniref:Uncharacterized protein n=1 Tax=Brachionus plicatilis TaxID=10195 RepID=A0A3M7SZU7_BRAPC|nr:hypothetical protein BpHYR1_039617 [Brachionus plicatilis]
MERQHENYNQAQLGTVEQIFSQVRSVIRQLSIDHSLYSHISAKFESNGPGANRDGLVAEIEIFFQLVLNSSEMVTFDPDLMYFLFDNEDGSWCSH